MRPVVIVLLALSGLATASPPGVASERARPQERRAAADTVPPDTSGGRAPRPPGAPGTVPPDTYADPAVEALIARAKSARDRVDSTIHSLQVTFRERLYVGVSAERFRRERSLYRQERAARVRLERDGDRVVRWLGARSGTPFGDADVPLEDEDFDFLRPDADRLFLQGSWAVHPLADSAAAHYRYRSGDTLRVRLPALGRTVTLVEAVVEPREARFDLVTGSLWFDEESAQLVRAAYRPARRYELPDDELEGFAASLLRPVTATVDYLTVEYGLQQLRWWLPDRMAFSGEARIAGSLRVPLRVEWSFEGWEVDAPPGLDVGQDLPPGWRRTVTALGPDDAGADSAGVEADTAEAVAADSAEADAVAAGDSAADPGAADREPPGPWAPGDSSLLVVIVPPPDSLAASPELPPPLGRGESAFVAGELAALRDELGRIPVPAAGLGGPRLEAGPRLLRYNRVEGPSAAVRLTWPLRATTDLLATPRLGGDLEPNGELAVVRRHADGSGALALAAYRRLEPMGDWGAPLGLGNSLGTLLFGRDDGLYYRTAGAEARGQWRGDALRLEGRLFAERHRAAEKTTDFSVPDLVGDHALPPNPEARRADLAGVAARLRWQAPGEPGRGGPALSGSVWGEAAAGDVDFGRLAATAAAASPLALGLDGALEVGTGGTAGTPPPQRLWYLGGPYSLRGFAAGALSGEAFWMARAEAGLPIATGPETPIEGEPPVGRGLRLAAFADAAWAGGRDAFGAGGPAVGVGAGISLLDGLLRIDLARGVRRGDEWRLHVYSDGLF